MLTDFDGTLSPIVDDPPRPGRCRARSTCSHRLAESLRAGSRWSRAGRRRSWPSTCALASARELWPSASTASSGRDGDAVVEHADAERLARRSSTRSADAAERAGPRRACGVEHKGLSLTLHFRTAPEHEAEWARALGRGAGAASPAWSCTRPACPSSCARPSPSTRARVVAELADGPGAGLLPRRRPRRPPAFDALDRLAGRRRAPPCGWRVRSDEAPAELLDRADLVVDGPAGAVESSCRALLADFLRLAVHALSIAQSRRSAGAGGPQLVVEPVGGGAAAGGPLAQRRRGGPARRAPSSSASASDVGRAGDVERVDLEGARPSSSHTPASRLRASTPSRSLSSAPSLATRLSPSRTGLTSSTS